MRRSCRRLDRAVVMVLAVPVLAGLVGCGDDSDTSATSGPTTSVESSTTAPVTTTPSSTSPETSVEATVPMGENIESLSYLIQGLLTTEQIGGGWVDQGRHLVPPGSDQLTGFLCPTGDAAVAALAGTLDPQVSTTFERPGDVGLWVSETLMWGDRDVVDAGFTTFGDAVQRCAGSSYSTAELGELSLVVDDPPAIGTAALSFHFAPTTPPTDTPWLEQWSTAVYLADPNQPVALVVGINASVMHDPGSSAATQLDAAEYSRIVTAAVDRILSGL